MRVLLQELSESHLNSITDKKIREICYGLENTAKKNERKIDVKQKLLDLREIDLRENIATKDCDRIDDKLDPKDWDQKYNDPIPKDYDIVHNE